MNKRLRKKIDKRQIIKRIRCIKVPSNSVMFVIIDSTKCKPDMAQKIADFLRGYIGKKDIKAFVVPDCIKDVQVFDKFLRKVENDIYLKSLLMQITKKN